jgi:hypothetical protein
VIADHEMLIELLGHGIYFKSLMKDLNSLVPLARCFEVFAISRDEEKEFIAEPVPF